MKREYDRMCGMKKLNAGTAIIATLFIVSGAIYAGSWQASLLAQMPTSQFDCSPIDCWNGEYAPTCDAAGNPINYFEDPCGGGYPECGNSQCDEGEQTRFVEVGGGVSGGGGDGESWRFPEYQKIFEIQHGSCTDDCPLDCPQLDCEEPSYSGEIQCFLAEKERFEEGCQVACPVYNCYDVGYDYGDGDNEGSYGGYGDSSVCGDGQCNGDEDAQSCKEDCFYGCPSILCAAPPQDCWYTPPYKEDANGCQVSCGEIACDEKCFSVDCAAPPEGCWYENPEFDRECQVSCGQMKCKEKEIDRFDCNPIVCEDGRGHPRCTPEGHPINYFVDPCFKPSAPKHCEYNGVAYAPGEKFKDADDCNTCYCDDGGNVSCTEMYCGGNDDNWDDQDEVLCEGQYHVGESYMASDGCNKCTCSESGVGACTRMACPLDQPVEPVPGCGYFLCAGENGMYEVEACDAAGNTVDNPCGSTNDSDDDSEPEYEEEVVTAPPIMNRFNDVTSQTLEGEAANALAEKDIIGGFPDGSFRGGQPVNRAEAAKFLLMSRLGVKNNALNNGRFTDVLEGEWYVKYVVTAAELGVIDGYKDGTFRPANTVNTAEFLKMLTGAFDLPQNIEHGFTDVPSDAWFARYAGAADAFNLFPGRPEGRLQPEKLLTRGEVSIAIYRILNAQ
jgi:hypothetical protein